MTPRARTAAIGSALTAATAALLLTLRTPGLHQFDAFMVADRAVPPPPAAAPSAPATLDTDGPKALRLRVIRYQGGPTLESPVTAGGTTASLEQLFADVKLQVTLDVQPELPNPFGSGALKPEELHNLLTTPVPGASDWQVAAFLIPNGVQVGDLGALIAERTRDRFAVFGKAHAGDKRRILRTTAHELGHALNLFHNDGDGDFACCAGEGSPRTGTTVMNKEECLRPGMREFRFGPAEKDHLLKHPIDNVRPNSHAPFGTCALPHEKKC